jgi:hypothetical protein
MVFPTLHFAMPKGYNLTHKLTCNEFAELRHSLVLLYIFFILILLLLDSQDEDDYIYLVEI